MLLENNINQHEQHTQENRRRTRIIRTHVKENDCYLILRYGHGVFKKTRFHSQVIFINRCIRSDIIPQDFRHNRDLHTEIPGIRTACHAFSKRTMKITLNDYRKKLIYVTDELSVTKIALEKSVNIDTFIVIKDHVKNLNCQLDTSLNNIKDKKFTNLQPHSYKPDNTSKSVVTIPTFSLLLTKGIY